DKITDEKNLPLFEWRCLFVFWNRKWNIPNYFFFFSCFLVKLVSFFGSNSPGVCAIPEFVNFMQFDDVEELFRIYISANGAFALFRIGEMYLSFEIHHRIRRVSEI